MSKLKIEKQNKKTYIKCNQCGDILVISSPKLKWKAISSCKHFLVSEIWYDSISYSKAQENLSKSVKTFFTPKYVIAIIPRNL